MPLKLSKLLAVWLAVIVASALLIIRFVSEGHDRYWMLAHDLPATAVYVYWWLILRILAIVVLGAWISYRWIFKR
jgi:hypothetical protein